MQKLNRIFKYNIQPLNSHFGNDGWTTYNPSSGVDKYKKARIVGSIVELKIDLKVTINQSYVSPLPVPNIDIKLDHQLYGVYIFIEETPMEPGDIIKKYQYAYIYDNQEFDANEATIVSYARNMGEVNSPNIFILEREIK